MRAFCRNSGLSLVLLAVFLLTWVGQFATGLREYNDEQHDHGAPPLSAGAYLASGHFWRATAENWESEFLQMAMFVVLTCFLFQKGSPESRDPDEAENPADNDPALSRGDPRAPWPVRRGGPVLLWVYSHSLSLCFGLLFLASFALHAQQGAREYNAQAAQHGHPPTTAVGYLGTSRFWFEAFQNWQSEFLSLAAMVYLSVYLRERGSAESKPVATPHDENGDDEPVRKPPAAGRTAGGRPDELTTVGARARPA